MIRTLDARSLGVERVACALARPPARVAPEIQRAVEGIVDAVRERGDAELLELTARFDGFSAPAAAALAIPRGEFEAAERALSSAARAALVYAAERIERYHAAALRKSWRVPDEHACVFGAGGSDLVAGPSGGGGWAGGGRDPGEGAADLPAQAEHDPMARAVLITDASDLLPRIGVALERQLARLPRRAIAAEALAANGALVVVASLDQAVELANRLAPEHLELLVRVPQALLPRVRHAGAVFVGGQTPEVVGDYVAGPSHVLPTAGTARFSSPLGAEDFVKRSSIIEYSRAGLAAALPHLRTLTDIEGLGGHRAAAEVRAKGDTA